MQTANPKTLKHTRGNTGPGSAHGSVPVTPITSKPITQAFFTAGVDVGTPTWQQTGNSSNGPLLPQDIQQATPTNSGD
jgi:hypothetical protein